MPGDVAVEWDQGERRFEARLDGEGEPVGYLTYEDAGEGVVALTHTVVAPEARGQGVGEALVGGALARLREAGTRIVPVCHFVAGYLEQHPEERELVAVGR